MPKRRQKGDGSIYYNEKKKLFIGQVSNGYDSEGKRLRITITGKTKSEALKNLKEAEHKIKTGLYVSPNKITIENMAKLFLENKLNQNIIKEPTYFRHLETLKMLEEIYNTPLQKATENQLQAFLNEKLNYSQSTLNKIYSLLKNAFKEGLKRKIITVNPMEYIQHPKSKKKKEIVRALTREEQKKLTNILLTENILYSEQMLLSMANGMRMGEINALDAKHINFKHSFVDVKNTISKGKKGEAIVSPNPKTNAGERKVPITSSSKRILQSAVGFRTEGLIFTHKNKLITTNQVNCEFQRVIEKYDILDKTITSGKVSLHSLRHTFGTRCVEAGMPAVVLKEIMGHTDIRITLNTYYYATTEYIHDTLESAESILTEQGLTISENQLRKRNNNIKIS